MRILAACIIVLGVLAILNGQAVQDRNKALAAKCDPYGGVWRTQYDEDRLVAVTCSQTERRFHQ